MRTIATLLLLAASTIAAAQTPTTTVTPNAIEKAGIQGIEQEVGQTLKDLNDFDAEIVKSHPGYHFDLQSGLIVKDTQISKPTAPATSGTPVVNPAAK